MLMATALLMQLTVSVQLAHKALPVQLEPRAQRVPQVLTVPKAHLVHKALLELRAQRVPQVQMALMVPLVR